MDASELELDAKLYKASSTLLAELRYKLPLLVYHPGTTPQRHRLRVLDTKCFELRALLDRFQEWPQLLDPFLAALIQLLTNAFISYLTSSVDQYGPTALQGTASTSPLPRAICGLLYSFCKVRGYKVIVRLLNNEPKYLSLMLSTFRAWDTPSAGMTWEERYIMLLWLSHLMLAPFELANISVRNGEIAEASLSGELVDLPGLAGEVTSLAFKHLGGSGKEREAASILLVRLSLRNDMQRLSLPQRIVAYASRKLLSDTDMVASGPYQALGYLSLLYGITNSGSDSEVAPHVQTLFATTMTLATDQKGHFKTIRDSAPARKWLLKILRAILIHAISLNLKRRLMQPHQADTLLEDSIQYFLDALGDRDTPVRMAAAKSLSLVVLQLDPAMSADVVEAVLDCLQENLLLEDSRTQKLIPITDKARDDLVGMKRNISAVDPLRWHGLMLTLAHLLFRRSPPPNVLSEIVQALILGLEFEQRSNAGTSIGTGVRDAACFGLWALARKYSTSELDLVPMAEFADSKRPEYSECNSVLQLVAVKLVISACLDPSGNIRRGSSAALQELIGRHPDTIAQGISVVQVVDYHAVARLSRAMTEVSPLVAARSEVYHKTLLYPLTEWRGARAADVNQRRWASHALQALTKTLDIADVLSFANAIHSQLLDLRPVNIGTTAAARHGLLLALSYTLRSLRQQESRLVSSWLGEAGSAILEFKNLTGKIEGRTTADIELVMEAIATYIGEVCRCWEGTTVSSSAQQAWMSTAIDVLNLCTVAGTRDNVVQCSAETFLQLFKLLPRATATTMIKSWLDKKEQAPAAFASKGRLKALGLIHNHLEQEEVNVGVCGSIITHFTDIVEGSYRIETRVDAMQALGIAFTNGSRPGASRDTMKLSNVLRHGLSDYTNDQRGDIGSTLRLQTLETVDVYREHFRGSTEDTAILQDVMPLVVKLAAEKLNNVRFRAWKCLELHWRMDTSLASPRVDFPYPADVFSVAYFQQLMELLSVSWARRDLICGLVSSATAGSEDICRAAGNACVWYVQSFSPEERTPVVEALSKIVLDELAAKTQEEDRHVVPVLDFLCFMIDENIFATNLIDSSEQDEQDIWSTMQAIHSSSSSLQRIEASLNVYSRLLSIDVYRARALDKLTRQLLHRWPKVRYVPVHSMLCG